MFSKARQIAQPTRTHRGGANNQQQPTEGAPTVDETAATPVEDARTLNGAQTQSLLSVIEKWKSGELSEDQAVKVISLSCGISEDDARSILRGR